MQLNVGDFSLRHTLECGQFFRYEKVGDSYFVVAGDNLIKLGQEGDKLFFESNTGIDSAFISRFFRLDYDYGEIISSISKDSVIRAAIEKYHGLHLIRQEPFECLLSYICAAFSNIPRIKGCINNMAVACGRPLHLGDYRAFSFPAKLSHEKLKSCGLGYRCDYVYKTANLVDNSYFNRLRKLGYADAKKELMKLPGVGSKVADCVLLYSLDFLEAVPMDVWMKRIAEKHYSNSFKSYFGKYAGYAQQFLYHYFRNRAK